MQKLIYMDFPTRLVSIGYWVMPFLHNNTHRRTYLMMPFNGILWWLFYF